MSSLSAVRIAPDSSRHNFYYVIHRGLRFGHCRLLAEIGSTDFGNAAAVKTLVAHIREFLGLARSHLEGENREIHTALEARAPGASAHAADDHAGHETSFAELEALLQQVESAAPARAAAAGQALYSRYAIFAAHDYEHMAEEETALLAALQQSFTDAELIDIEHRIVAAIPPHKMAAYLRLMMPAINHPERVGFAGKLQAAMPAAAFEDVMDNVVKPVLPPAEYDALALGALMMRAA